ncbi:MAG: TolC family protein, partial [Candidatus Eremiobacterota bacterium]
RLAMEIGLANSLGVSLANAEVEAARAQTLQAGSEGRLAFATDFQKLRGEPDRMWDASPGLSSGLSSQANPENLGMVRARVSYPLWGGAFRERMQVAELAEKQAMSNLALAFRDSARRIRHAYFRVLLERDRLAVADWEVRKRRELLAVAEAQLASGKVAPFVVYRHQSELAAAEQRTNVVRAGLVSSEATLKAALGVEVTSTFRYLDRFESPPDPGSQDDLLARALEDRPDLIAARFGVEEGARRINLAHAEHGLQVNVGAQYSTVGNGGLDARYTGQYTGGLSLSMPIFDGGNYQAEVDKAEALKKSRELQLADLELEVTRQVVEARARLDAARANQELSETARARAEEDMKIAIMRFEVGQGEPLDALDTLMAVSRARFNWVQAAYDANVAYADLLFATGRF